MYKSRQCLPKPPVPPLDHCLDRYIEYAEVVAEGQNRDIRGTIRAVEEFRRVGVTYQQRLQRLAESESNWINQFWLPEMYLRIRLPLPVNTNPAYIFPQQHFRDEDDWLRYTALLIRGMVDYKNKIDTKQLEREFSTGKVKVRMCMKQYDNILSCYSIRILISVEVNCVSLTWAQEAVFVVCLDDEDRKSSPALNWSNAQNYEEDLVLRGKHILTGGGSRGHGANRWYDATIQLVVGSSGTNGLCIEHSTAEGIVIINMAESALRYERENRKRNLISRPEREIRAKPLTWHVDAEAIRLLEKQKAALDELTKELDLGVLIFNDFGRDFIKGSKFSPDGFVQLALQLAHFKLHGYLVSTYESASLRRYRSGRVDNIRANTKEALEWETKMTLLKKAAEKQAKVTQEVC
ncbi:Choline/Carnitine O-acyltransferase [Ancylostoma caninum]|uniref:Choline O-acetyltransferase n=1 Tax=Ancylostoma caninum TaxID=29170 RepID=A0A368FW34_ANCCA|nr:Choline/Carnitine O-acyltransferase [Ancylostoma caninum]